MASRTALLERVRAHDAAGVAAGLAESPELKDWRDGRGRNWLHICCMAEPKAGAAASIATADVLIAAGFDVSEAAFLEGDWRATPVWHAVSRGRNPALAAHLLEAGANPDYALWAAAFRDDLAAIDLLVAHGATVDDPSVPDETPFLGAVKTSRFAAAERLLAHGADVDARDGDGRTALHLMLRKASEKPHFEMILRHGPRGDIPDRDGVTAAEILRRKKDPEFRAMAGRLATSAG